MNQCYWDSDRENNKPARRPLFSPRIWHFPLGLEEPGWEGARVKIWGSTIFWSFGAATFFCCRFLDFTQSITKSIKFQLGNTPRYLKGLYNFHHIFVRHAHSILLPLSSQSMLLPPRARRQVALQNADNQPRPPPSTRQGQSSVRLSPDHRNGRQCIYGMIYFFSDQQTVQHWSLGFLRLR